MRRMMNMYFAAADVSYKLLIISPLSSGEIHKLLYDFINRSFRISFHHQCLKISMILKPLITLEIELSLGPKG